MRTLFRRKQTTTCLAFSPDGTRLAVGGRVGPKAGRVDVWDLRGGEKPVTLPSLDCPPWQLALATDGSLALVVRTAIMSHAGERGMKWHVTRAWDIENWTNVSLHPDGRRAVVDTKATVTMAEVTPGAFRPVWERPATPGRDSAGPAAFSPDGGRLAVKGERSIEVWDAATGTRLAVFEAPDRSVTWWFGSQLRWSPDGRWIAEKDQMWVKMWDAESGRMVHKFVAGSDMAIIDCAFHPASGSLAVVTENWRCDPVIRMLDPDGWQETTVYRWPVGRISAVAFSPDGTLAAVGGDEPEVVVWDMGG